MMQTPLPLLRDLSAGVVVQRCQHCAQLVLRSEHCPSADAAVQGQCPGLLDLWRWLSVQPELLAELEQSARVTPAPVDVREPAP
jgi:hypothetical protein